MDTICNESDEAVLACELSDEALRLLPAQRATEWRPCHFQMLLL